MSETLADGPAWVHLDTVRAVKNLGGEQALLGLLPMLQELLERELPQIAQLLESGDVRGVNPPLHALKGCVPLFCTPELAQHLAEVEHLSKTAERAELSAAFAVLGPQLLLLQQEAQRYML